MDAGSLTQFGLGAVLIGAFFIPFVMKQYNDNKQLNKDIQSEKDKRISDMQEVIKTVTPLLQGFNTTANSLIEVVHKHGKKQD